MGEGGGGGGEASSSHWIAYPDHSINRLLNFGFHSGGRNWCTNVLETEAPSASVAGRCYFISFRGSSEFSIELSKLKS